MDTITGLPAHPLLVHIPVAMLPLAALGVLVMLIKRAWYERYRWAVLFVGFVGMIGAFLATASGEGLEKILARAEGREAVRAVHEHAEAGEMARNLAILFFVAIAAWVLIPWFLERAPRDGSVGSAANAEASGSSTPSWLRPLLMAFAAIAAVASMISVVNAGHSGADKAWEDLEQGATEQTTDGDGG